jgi:hypothetical protein
MAGCLDGIRVLELARFQAGPRAGMVLSDLGAEVIKIEKFGGEETRKSAPIVRGQSVYFSVYNRGKKSICLDLRKAEGKAVFFDLLKTADFVLENFRPGTIEDMGLGYDELIEVKPDIILVRCSGFGQTGPYKDRPSFDPLGQAMSGLMSLTGKPLGRPVGTAFSLVDRTTALHATIGALGALRHRDRTGEGQIIDVCLLDSAGGERPAFVGARNAGESAGPGGRGNARSGLEHQVVKNARPAGAGAVGRAAYRRVAVDAAGLRSGQTGAAACGEGCRIKYAIKTDTYNYSMKSGQGKACCVMLGLLRLISPFPPGGGTDTVARVIAQRYTERFAQPAIVDNRVGGNGTLGTAFAAKAAGDFRWRASSRRSEHAARLPRPDQLLLLQQTDRERIFVIQLAVGDFDGGNDRQHQCADADHKQQEYPDQDQRQ